MKRPAIAIISLIALFSTVVISQTFNSTNASWAPWRTEPPPPPPPPFPMITVKSPLQDQSYPSNNIWLNFSLTKPYWFHLSNYEITSVAYCVDGTVSSMGHISDNYNENETVVNVKPNPNDRQISFSFILEELTEGKHSVEICVNGYIRNLPSSYYVGIQPEPLYSNMDSVTGRFNETFPRIRFVVATTTTPKPTPTPTLKPEFAFPTVFLAGGIIVVVVAVVLVFLLRRK